MQQQVRDSIWKGLHEKNQMKGQKEAAILSSTQHVRRAASSYVFMWTWKPDLDQIFCFGSSHAARQSRSG